MTSRVLRMIEEQDHRDEEGRLIREGRTPARFIRPGEIEYKTCPYAGSRHQHAAPMNVSALRQISAHWDDILDATAVLRAAYAEQRPGTELMDLWRIGQLGSALPWYFLLAGAPHPPVYAAALAKITLGVGLWAQRALVDLLAGAPPHGPFSAQQVYDSTEANGTLIGEREVCSGPEKMMLRYFEVLVGGAPGTMGPQIQRLVAERERVLLFGAHYANFKLLLWIHFLARRFVYADLIAALGPAHPAAAGLTALLRGPCEPPDFFTVGPPDHAVVPPASRAMWIGSIAQHVVPMAPDRSDTVLQAAALAIGLALGTTDPPPDAIAELRGAPNPELAARAIATYAKLDALLGQVAATVEDAFRRADPGAPAAAPFDAALRDRLLGAPPRALLAQIAPGSLAALTPP